MIDIVVHAPSKDALYQWLAARGLGLWEQDMSGQWVYGHTDASSTFIWWRHPSGKLEVSVDRTDPENPVVSFSSGFYGILRFMTNDAFEAAVAPWIRTNTAVSVLEGFAGYGGEGVTILVPDEINAHMDAIGMPRHEFSGGCDWSDPRVWWASPVMTGDQREIDGITYKSLIDFNVWSPTQYPGGWQEVVVEPPAGPEPWVQPTGGHDAYALGAEVTHNGQTWRSTVDANVWEPGVFGWTTV